MTASFGGIGATGKRSKQAHLIQNAVRRILHDANDALGTGPSRRHLDVRFAIVSEARLHHGRQQIGPVARGGLIERGAEEPGCHGVDRGHEDEVAADVEVGDVVFGEVDGEAAAGWGAFEIIVEAYGGGSVEVEVRGGLSD